MHDPDRFRLLGRYKTPRFRSGKIVSCAARGRVEIVGLSDAPIPWPIGKRGRGRTLVLYKGLDRAVRKESEAAVCHGWGVCPTTVWKWRNALGIARTQTQGTLRPG